MKIITVIGKRNTLKTTLITKVYNEIQKNGILQFYKFIFVVEIAPFKVDMAVNQVEYHNVLDDHINDRFQTVLATLQCYNNKYAYIRWRNISNK